MASSHPLGGVGGKSLFTLGPYGVLVLLSMDGVSWEEISDLR